MSFQAYLDNIKLKTGKVPDDFKKLAEEKGFMQNGVLDPKVKAGQIVAWLKQDFDLGHGHAMAIYGVLSSSKQPKISKEESIGNHFSGARSHWRKTFDELSAQLKTFGDGFTVSPASSYISLLRDGNKFAIVKVTKEKLDIGIKLKKKEPTNRFELAGSWNAMVTHRVQVTKPKQVDKELINWLHKAYEQNSKK